MLKTPKKCRSVSPGSIFMNTSSKTYKQVLIDLFRKTENYSNLTAESKKSKVSELHCGQYFQPSPLSLATQSHPVRVVFSPLIFKENSTSTRYAFLTSML